MKKQPFNSPVYLLLLIVAFTGIHQDNVKAQCSANVNTQTDTITACAGSWVSIPITLTGQPPFNLYYQINGQPFPLEWVVAHQNNFVLWIQLPDNGWFILFDVTDATGCDANILDSRVYFKPPVLEFTTNITPVSCAGANNGSAGVTVTGGTPPYGFQWSNGSHFSYINGASGGNYGLTVTESSGGGCSGTTNVEIPEAAPIVITTVPVLSTCNNSDGSIDATISGGIPPYQIAWSNGSTGEDLTNLAGGTYTITVTDASGCTGTYTEHLGPFELTIQSSLSNCLTDFNLNVSGGTGPYTYLWSNGAATEDLIGLSGGTYTVTVMDASGCPAITSVTANTLTPVTANIVVNNSLCSGNLTAQVIGWPASNTIFLWSTGATVPVLNYVPVGTYTVTVTTGNSCTATASVTTTEPLSVSNLLITPAVTHVQCNGASTGAINLTVSGSAPPFTYSWSNGSNTQVINNLPAGLYIVTVTDANGCTATMSRPVVQNNPVNATWAITPSTCNANVGSINLSVSGGASNFFYNWVGPSGFHATVQDISNLSGGIYRITVTDVNGCTYISPDINVQPLPFSVSIEVLSAQCNSATLSPVISGSSGPYQYTWAGPDNFTANTQNIAVTTSGTYTVIVIDVNGCLRQASAQVSLTDGPCGFINGRVLSDDVDNCLTDPGETGLAGWLVRAESTSEVYYGVSDTAGTYRVNVHPGTYTLSAIAPNGLWAACPAGPEVTLNMAHDTVSGGDLLMKPVYTCPSLSVVIGTALLRRCFSNNTYYVTYSNDGTSQAENAYILVTLDAFLSPVSATVPYIDLGNGILRFEVGDLEPGESHTFQLKIQVSCLAVLGQTHCTEAHIYPDGNCIPANSSWSGASLRVTSQCNTDSVLFIIKNISVFDMQSTSDYIVVEDAVMLMQSQFQLEAEDSTIVAVPTNGSTWRMEVDQVVFHPGLSSPSLSVEGCSNTPQFSTGFVTQFPNDDLDPWIDIDCRENTGSFDPNDKQGFPVGYGQDHYIRPGTELEYLIRFQNTGTDTAFTVRIADTLSAWLDPATIRPGVSSHAYQFDLTGLGIAEFLFENILLPDSNVNEAASHGFVKFSIYPKADAPLETLIENTAHIYFDFNDAVVTNTTRHRLGENFILVGAWQPQRPEYQVLVSPNPFRETARLEVKGLDSPDPLHLQIIDLHGKIVYDETAAGPVLTLKKTGLPAGLYLFKLDQKGVMVGSGKLIIQL